MIPATLNLYFKQGAGYALSLTILQGSVIRVAEAIEAGATSITVQPIKEAIASGRYILFDDLRVQLTAGAAYGATTLSVAALALPIAKSTSGQVCADLTDCTARSQFKGKLSQAATPNTFAIAFADDRLTGDMSLTLTDEETTLVPANLALGTVLSDSDLQQRDRQTNDYDWDLEIEYPDGWVESPLKGLVVVYPETTKIT
jgi:hypothetical protein